MTAPIQISAAAFALACALTACTSQTAPAQSASAQTAQPPAQASANMRDNCIRPSQILKQTVVSDEEIRFEMRNGETWVNRLPGRCSGLKIEGGFAWDIPDDFVCSNQQTVRVLSSGIPCQLGVFSRLPAQPN